MQLARSKKTPTPKTSSRKEKAKGTETREERLERQARERLARKERERRMEEDKQSIFPPPQSFMVLARQNREGTREPKAQYSIVGPHFFLKI
jgi:hypothetical protein